MGEPFEELTKRKKEKTDKKRQITYEEGIIDYLQGCEQYTATQQSVLKNVKGRDERKLEALEKLKSANPPVLTVTGNKQSPVNPLTLTLHPDKLSEYRFFDGQFGITNCNDAEAIEAINDN